MTPLEIHDRTISGLLLSGGCSRAELLRREERRTRIRLGESLQALWPSLSVNGRQPAAQATPALYDIVSS